MEPQAKRSRTGPSPFDHKTAPVDDDELNLRPEEVNALRDPGIQLQKSRAFAAFKLKSAFENIFEKYGRDFTGIGDEIDLRTGEIVVDNGHIQSLEESTMNREEDEEDEDAGEEEGILPGGPGAQLGLLERDLPPLVLSSDASVFPGPWSSPSPCMGAPPLLSSMIDPGCAQMWPYSASMSHGIPEPAQNIDPAWRATDLPPQVFGNGYGPSAPPKRKKAKMKIPFIPEGDEDDILLGASTTVEKEAVGNSGPVVPVSHQNSPHDISGEGGAGGGMAADVQPGITPMTVRVKYKLPEMLAKDALKYTKSGGKRRPSKKAAAVGDVGPGKQREKVGSSRSVATKKNQGATESKATIVSSATSTPNKEADLYINTSIPEGVLATKPTNQKLRVEIQAMAPADISSYVLISPEPSPEPEMSQLVRSRRSVENLSGAILMDEVPTIPMPQGHTGAPESCGRSDMSMIQSQLLAEVTTGATEQDEARKELNAGPGDPSQSAEVEVFSRNTLDPSYAFSDDDEPTIPRRQLLRYEPVRPKEVLAVQEETTIKAATLLDQASSPTATPSVTSTRLTASFEVLSPVTQGTEPQADAVESHPEDDGTIMAGCSSQQTAPSSVERTIKTPSLLRMKPRRSGIRRSLISPNNTITPTELVLDSVEQPLREDCNAEPDLPVSRKRDRSYMETASEMHISSDELTIISTSARIPYDRIIPETPEPSPEPQAPRRHPRQASPDLGMSPRPDIFPLADEDSPTQDPPNMQVDRQEPRPSPPPKSKPKANPPPPKTPSQKRRLSRPAGTSSSARTGILSLISDDEDELSLDPSDFTPSGTRRPKPKVNPTSSAPHKSLTSVRNYLASSSSSTSKKSTSTLTKRGAIVGARTPASSKVSKLSLGNVSKLAIRSGGRGPGSLMRGAAGSGPGREPVSPASGLGSELIQTPGGSMRRCGEGDFRCDRDFCFVCL
ncbi:hypothetical protein B0T16DRAFT_399667 [Cercophora newfieldiana]|uniref:Myb-like DNA-binding domain protein n=1 Tax=Cercophora newfieldiana TaxID=92897 RepID=A0AA39YSD2_9PEZI|nr:hypothetical protein B0T16DRAFT_399667 [Cercophora newfieldiana]